MSPSPAAEKLVKLRAWLLFGCGRASQEELDNRITHELFPEFVNSGFQVII
jgi:hypothetical protein